MAGHHRDWPVIGLHVHDTEAADELPALIDICHQELAAARDLARRRRDDREYLEKLHRVQELEAQGRT